MLVTQGCQTGVMSTVFYEKAMTRDMLQPNRKSHHTPAAIALPVLELLLLCSVPAGYCLEIPGNSR